MTSFYAKRITGKLLAFGVNLHIKAIGRHVQKFQALADAATLRSEQAASDVTNAKRAYAAAVDAEFEAADQAAAVIKAAHAEIAKLPSVNGYGVVRADPPFGAAPQVIDKRK